jgi:hypothetical protein
MWWLNGFHVRAGSQENSLNAMLASCHKSIEKSEQKIEVVPVHLNEIVHVCGLTGAMSIPGRFLVLTIMSSCLIHGPFLNPML